jgi:thioesterase domain-containing protein
VQAGEALAASIEAMAASYIDAIRKVQPQGPYQLLGWSFGGIVAYEMANQLRHAGENIALLALLDTSIPHAEESSITEAEFIAAVVAETMWDVPEGISTVTQLVEVLKSRGMVSPDFPLETAERIAAVPMNAVRLMSRYRPPTLCDRLIFIRATQQTSDMQVLEDSFDWSSLLVKEQITIRIACKHTAMMSPPNAEIIANELIPYLAGNRISIASSYTSLQRD